MKRWYQALGAVCFFLLCFPSVAAGSVVLEKTVLELKATEGEEFREIIQFNSYASGKWVEASLQTRLVNPEDTNVYHSNRLKLGFPKLRKNLGLELNQQWNARYQIIDGGLDYEWYIKPGLKLWLSGAAGSKAARVSASERYRNHWNEELAQLNYDWRDWSYRVRIIRTDKVYPEADYYTALKYDLQQELKKKISPNFSLGVLYKEVTMDYPEDTSLTRAYWKDDWSLWARYKPTPNRRWDFSLRQLQWDKGLEAYFGPYQENYYFIGKYTRWNKVWNFSVGLTVADLNYLGGRVVFDPDEETTVEEDTKSRREQKLSLQLTRDWADFEAKMKAFAVSKDYQQGATKSNAGFMTTLTWKLKHCKLQLVVAPWGDLQTEKDYYQLKLEYRSTRK